MVMSADFHAETHSRPTRRPRQALGAGVRQGPIDIGLLQSLAIFAHDLRGPLANLALLLEVIGSLTVGSRTDAMARQAQGIVDALNDLLTSMLARVRATGDPLSADGALVDLDRLVEQVWSLNRPIAERRAVLLERSGLRNVTLLGDAQLLRQALDNLIGNAVKHSPSGSSVSCEVEVENGHAVIRIRDRGPGIRPEEIGRLFRPFMRLSTRATGTAPSVGLGLWIVRLIAERHGGSVAADVAVDGAGVTLMLRLPLAARVRASRRARPERMDYASPGTVQGQLS
jgi:signal transduction histidine kinase